MNPLSDDLSLDHVDPRGDNNDENLVTACRSCNSAKGDKKPDFLLAKLVNTKVEQPKIIKPEKEIIRAVARRSHLTYEQLIGPSRKKQIVIARARAIKELRKNGMVLSDIGLLFNRHHSSVLHLLKMSSS